MPVEIHPDDMRFVFGRTGGPGGQNVNKVNTAVRLIFDFAGSRFFSEEEKRRLDLVATSRRDGTRAIIVEADTYRTQGMNRALAVRKLVKIVEKALEPPAPERVATDPPGSVRATRMKHKKRRGAVKASRRDPPWE